VEVSAITPNTAEELGMDVRRLLPLSGVVFVVLAVVAVVGLGGDTPSNDASGTEVLSFYDAHSVRQAIAAFVFAVSVPFLVFFGISLATTAWPQDRRPVWQYVLIAGSGLAGAALLVAAWAHFALADAGDNTLSPDTLQALNVLDADSWVLFNTAFGVMLLGAAGCLIPRAGRHRWLAWAALVLGILLFIPFADFFALILTLIWMIVVSVMLFRGAGILGGGAPAPAQAG
jgi:hypothetical protein